MLGDMNDVITYRTLGPHDLNFIRSSWSNGLYHGSDWYSLIPKDLFFPRFHLVMEHIFKKPNLTVYLAVVKEEPDAIVGYSVYETDQHENRSVHWLFVKPQWRNKGLGRSLIPLNAVQATHMTKIGKSILRKYPNAVFNPFAI